MKKNKVITILIAACAFVTFLFIGKSIVNNNDNKESENKKVDNSGKVNSNKIINVNMEIENYGTISLELYEDIAPITVENFVNLVNSGFYDGLTFHRIMDGFMIQGGDPQGDGFGGSDKTIKGEFGANGFTNPLKHERGVISMARANNPNSASSQFFIMQKTNHSLDGYYAAFGKVTSGIEIVDKICEDTKVEDDNGTVLKENQPRITKVYVVK